MKQVFLSFLFLMLVVNLHGQTPNIFTTNTTPVGLEHNILFNANTRFSVTTTGPQLTSVLNNLFDGKFVPNYTSIAPSIAQPTTVLIENLPLVHTQLGAWVGWSTRYWPSKNFKIEGFDSYASPNVWKTIADYSTINYSGSSFVTKIPSAGAYTKLKFTFYSATGTNGRLGISELFFINPEAVRPYEGLFETSLTNNWINNGTSINYMAGKVGIGTTAPDAELTVKGMIHAREVKVDLLGPLADYVFENYYNGNSTLNKEYKFLSLNEVEKFTKENKHLPNVPSAQEVKENGVQVGEITNILLEKVEELTLYLIEQKKEIERLKIEVNELKSAK